MTEQPTSTLVAQNTDKLLWEERPGDYYSDKIFVTQSGGIGINVGGNVIVQSVKAWHAMADRLEALERAKMQPPAAWAWWCHLEHRFVEHIAKEIISDKSLREGACLCGGAVQWVPVAAPTPQPAPVSDEALGEWWYAGKMSQPELLDGFHLIGPGIAHVLSEDIAREIVATHNAALGQAEGK